MQQRRRPGTRFLAGLATVALIAAACTGDQGGGATAAPPAASTPAESPAESMAPSESAGGESMAPSESAGTGFQFEQLGGSVSVLATWTGSEQESFMAMIQPWIDGTGAQVNYTGTRDLSTQITTGIASGNLPDVAGLPGPGQMADWYDQGALKSLDFVDFAAYESATPAGFASLGQAEDGTLVGIFTKGAVKGLIWYNTGVWQGEAPATWDELTSAASSLKSGDTATWCIGLESGGDSGWPGTDWIEDIVLRQSGPDVYDQWVAGELPWTSPEIRAAFETFGQALQDSHGGSNFIVTTNFGRAANPMFDDPPGCLLHHQASFITDFFANEAGAQPDDYDFFPFPDINASYAGSVTGGGDLFGMFNDTPQARSLIQWMLTPEAQQIWVERGGFISANSGVPLDAYPDEASRKSAEILANAQTFRFDGSDRMPSEMNRAFFEAMVEFAQNPTSPDPVLQRLDQVQADAYNQ
jgi:alpha-glucoside transport system substrate-binding protein